MFIQDVDEEISLRMLAVRDAEALFQLTNQSRDYLRQWLPWVNEIKTAEDSREFIKQSFYTYAEQSGLTAGIFYKGELAGVAGFNSFDWKNGIGYIGYWLSASYQGYGIMTRAVSALISHAFDELKLNRIDIRAASDNMRSRAIPERLGFTEEGWLHQTEWLYDHYVDHVVYGILASQWN